LTRMVTITSIQPNANVTASEFRFVAPKNARILDSTGY
jgi:outer membrane lipoprotein-sorting protein